MDGLSAAERQRLESWGLLSEIARRRGAGSGIAAIPGSAQPSAFAPEVEDEYQRLRAAYDALRAAATLELAAHERFRAEARALLRQLGVEPR